MLTACLLASSLGQHASAQDAEYRARARTRAPIAATNSEDATASGTTIEVRGRSSALEGLDELVGQTPGAHVQSSGGFGASSGVALRGAELDQTTVLFGDLALNTPETGSFDLSLVPLSVVDEVEIYRGGAPIWWSDGAIGGVVRLVPRSAQQSYLEARSGVGSFGRLELGASSAVSRAGGARPSLFTHVDVARADNDYSYVDDRSTRFDTAQGPGSADDITRHQDNAKVEMGNALTHAGLDLLGGRMDLVLLGHERSEGVPGPLGARTPNAHRRLVRALGALSWTKQELAADGERRYRLQLLASGNYQNSRFTDRRGTLELSDSIAANDEWTHAYARVAGSVALFSFLETTLIASLARDDYMPENPLAFSVPLRPSSRTSEALAFEARFHGAIGRTRLELRPSLRTQWSQTSIWVTGNNAANSARERHENTSPTYRVAGVIAPWSALAFSASASTGARMPSILELFGDRVSQEPNPSLRPEHSRTADLGAVLRGQLGELSGSLELRGFALFIDDLIGYRRNAQYTFKPENIDNARILGVELGTQAAYGRHLTLAGSLTTLQTRNQFDRMLPLRPPLQFSLRPELAVFPGADTRGVFFVEAEHTSYVYLYPDNSVPLQGRTIFSVGAALRFLQRHMTLAARAQNLFDVRATDVLSRPLPGFNFLLSLTVEDTLD